MFYSKGNKCSLQIQYEIYGLPDWASLWIRAESLMISSCCWYLLICICNKSFYFFYFFLSDTLTCPILGPLVALFWISGNVSSGFLRQSGFCLIHFAEANVMYIPWDPPLVLHIANLLMDSSVGHPPGSYLAQGYYCVAAVSLKTVINRSWVLSANHSNL